MWHVTRFAAKKQKETVGVVFVSVFLRCGRSIAGFSTVLLFVAALGSEAKSQTLLRGPGAAALDPLFEEVLEQPNNVEVNLAFARRAIELEDFEAAVSAMERMLIGRAGLPLIRLELGMLYLRLEAPELAEAYFLQVLESNEIDDDARQRAEVLLAETRDANARGSFAFTVSLGAKHQSNAVARPVIADLEDQITLEQDFNNGVPRTQLENADAPDSDVGTNASIGISYSRELDGLTERRFNASLNHYGSFQQGEGLDVLDVSVTSLRMGFVLPVARQGKAPMSFDPFISANSVNTDAVNGFSSTIMAGLSFNTKLRRNRPFAVAIEAGSKTHKQDDVADKKDATLINGSLTFGHAHRNGDYTSLLVRGSRVEAETDFESSGGGMINLSHSFRLFGRGLSASVGVSQTVRDEVSATALLPYRRRDTDVTASLATSWRIFGFSASLSANYIDRDSNIPQEIYDDLAATLNFSRSFQ